MDLCVSMIEEKVFFTMQEVEEMPVRVLGLVRFVRTDFV